MNWSTGRTAFVALAAAVMAGSFAVPATAATVVVDTGAANPTVTTINYSLVSSQTLFGKFTANVDTLTSIEGYFRNFLGDSAGVTATIYGDDNGGVDFADVLGSGSFSVGGNLTDWAGVFGLSIAVEQAADYWVGFSSNALALSMPNTAIAPLADYAATTRGDHHSASNLNLGVRITGEVAAVPEPATWALMIGGFGLAGAALRRSRPQLA